ncbi:schlafen family member 13-like isoform X1 [Haliotis rufescens]|uniref:schlafen family member 13-like isoform X1 n=1 Tax=Haliotis rufescens TaxID=6454 RepID=UPI001EB06A14|nr:schlafen family member 13-like isoform X1 [Haliotis rufescens]XP_046329961.1 schlafen family member 13-like isoform X1 [Haliotis rufescens]XP_046329969.1 schlafen family member 13-like isoform X1 [Haliotis rufescens]
MSDTRKRRADSRASPPPKRPRREPQITTRSSGPVTRPRCRDCSDACKKAKRHIKESNFLCIDIPVCLLYERIPNTSQGVILSKEQRVNKKKQLQSEFLEKACGLRNSGGGILLVHLVGLSSRDRHPGKLDEFTDDLLVKLIDDGTLFVDCFTKQWLDEKKELSDYYDFISITVRPKNQSVVTANFMTKIPFDSKIEDPRASNIHGLLSTRKTFRHKAPLVRGRGRKYRLLHESRNVQHKAFKAEKGNEKKLQSLQRDIPALVQYIWKDQRLREYITSFSKLDKGGSYFFGVAEEKREYGRKKYVSIKLVDHGINLSRRDLKALKHNLIEKVQSDILCCSYDGETLNIEAHDLVVIDHHLTKDKNYVIEVAVGAVEGLVFYDARGPSSFAIKEGELKRITCCEWFNTFKAQG